MNYKLVAVDMNIDLCLFFLRLEVVHGEPGHTLPQVHVGDVYNTDRAGTGYADCKTVALVVRVGLVRGDISRAIIFNW